MLSPGTGQGVALSYNGASVGTIVAPGGAVFGHLFIYGYAGNDTLRLSSGLAVPALLFAWAVTFMVGVIFAPGPVFGFITLFLGGSGGLLLYLLFSRALGIGEVAALTSTVKTRLRR